MHPNKQLPCIVAIESSCDDTSVAVLKRGKILANVTAQQHIHKLYGGVVPELASRNHEKNIINTFEGAMKQAKITIDEVDAFAFTQGPGLLGALLVGTSFTKSLAMALNKPLIAVNHLQAHVAALYIDNPKPSFPFMCLLVSGGHTQILLVKDYFDFTVVGSTLDDAAGEAFDKIGKMLNLPYPAGPVIDKFAQLGNKNAFTFTTSKVPNFDFSFSGFKTQILYFLKKENAHTEDFISKNIHDLCASVQNHIVNYLLQQVIAAIKSHPIKGLAIVGGVSTNSELREAFKTLATNKKLELMIPALEYCTDNAAMIAQAAFYKYQKLDFADLSITAQARF